MLEKIMCLKNEKAGNVIFLFMVFLETSRTSLGWHHVLRTLRSLLGFHSLEPQEIGGIFSLLFLGLGNND